MSNDPTAALLVGDELEKEYRTGPEVVRVLRGASVVIGPGEFVALIGASGVGKSTVAYGLAALEHTQWADDALAFRIDGPNAIAVTLPFVLKLRPASAAYFGTSLSATVVNRPEPQTARLAAVFLLDRADSADVVSSITRLDPAEALAALLPNAYRFQPQSSKRKRSTLRAYLDRKSVV